MEDKTTKRLLAEETMVREAVNRASAQMEDKTTKRQVGKLASSKSNGARTSSSA
jgi:hypothetical protein